MRAITWRPGSDSLYDPLFEHLRELNYRKKDHPLWQNYNQEHFYNECLALTIAFNQHNIPVLCGSILNRDCWPPNVYRIINRLWSVWQGEGPIRNLMPEGEHLLRSQIEWLQENTDVELIFISREAPNWQQWTVDQYKNNYNLEFDYDHYRYQVCATPNDDSCFQRIIYQGNENLLKQWARK